MAINSDQKRKNVRMPSAGRRSGGRSARKPERKAGQNSGQRAAQRSEHCPVVGLGGSAGGIDAFQAFFDLVPDEPGFAFVVVLHLSPDTQSHLSEVLRPHTGMPVEAVSEPVALRPNHVYVVQPNTILTLREAMLHPRSMDGQNKERRMSAIDHFFSSLAEEAGEFAAGILMSGTGTDGTLGLRAIKDYGGIALVQSPDSAKHSGMILNAICAGSVDQVLDIEDMPAALSSYFELLKDNRRRAFSDGARHDIVESLPRITALLHERTQHDFSNYKRPTLARRVQRRMQAASIETPEGYIELLRRDSGETENLLQDLLIGVTEFFRDPAAFAVLREKAIDGILSGRDPQDMVRAWVVGCSTGEEAYSIAIALLEKRGELRRAPDLVVFASDIDSRSLEMARRGYYPGPALANLPDDLVRRYFTPKGGGYLVKDFLREKVIFSEHNILRDPPFSNMDLISCRNLLIYLEPSVQDGILQIFHYVLRPDGFLFLGASETVARESGRYQVIDKQSRIYAPRATAEQFVPDFPLTTLPACRKRAGRATSLNNKLDWISRAERAVLDRFAPAWVIVDNEMRVIRFSRDTTRYMTVPAGMPTTDLFELAKAEFRPTLRSALMRALRTRERVTHSNLTVDVEGSEQKFDLVVEPLSLDARGNDLLCLVVFAETELLGRQRSDTRRHTQEARRRSVETDTENTELAVTLRETRERLQAVTEELETSNEELKASNEELASTNEELQSTNEELETSKEELQSSNEELQTVNAELSQRVEEVGLANNDLRNLFENTGVATLFLDKNLCIRNYTPPLTDIFHVVDLDKGRPLRHIAHRLEDGAVMDDVAGVINNLQHVEREVKMQEGDAIYTMRIRPYRTTDNRIDGAVLTFVDVTRIKESEQRLRESEFHQRLLSRELQHRVKNILANVRSLASQTYRNSADLNSFHEAFDGRLQALALAQNVLGKGSGQVSIKDLILEQLLSHALSPGETVSLEGPGLLFEPKAAQTFALVVHELITNAIKHGALATSSGQVSVRWRIEELDDGPALDFNWQEKCVVSEPDGQTSGYGRQLIEKALPYELGGEAKLVLASDGCRCKIRIPFNDSIRTCDPDEDE